MNDAKTIEVTIERTIPALPRDVFDAWLNPKIPGTPWNMADKLLLNPTVDGFFYWAIKGTPHYGRFTAVERAARIQHTWMSTNTSHRKGKRKKSAATMKFILISRRANGAEIPESQKDQNLQEMRDWIALLKPTVAMPIRGGSSVTADKVAQYCGDVGGNRL